MLVLEDARTLESIQARQVIVTALIGKYVT